ncbi:MAG: hypothetical protein B7Z20_12855, partial [Sphingobium sp. 32-64-5]
MEHADDPDPLILRLREGFDRIAFVARAELWAAAGEAGLNPTQAQVLDLLSGRPKGLRPKEIAAHLVISAASIADTLTALTRKGLVVREPDPKDARAAIIRATPDGLAIGRSIGQANSQVAAALASLPPAAKADLLLSQIALIRNLQLAGAVPMQRMRVSCRYFRPQAQPGADQPHFCEFVNAAIGDRDLRLDCAEHESA